MQSLEPSDPSVADTGGVPPVAWVAGAMPSVSQAGPVDKQMFVQAAAVPLAERPPVLATFPHMLHMTDGQPAQAPAEGHPVVQTRLQIMPPPPGMSFVFSVSSLPLHRGLHCGLSLVHC